MAFPAVQEAVENSTSTAGTNHTINLPTPTAGHLLLIILDKGSTAATVNAHASLTELLDENSANGLYIAYRWMDGSEPASYTLVTSASTRTASIAYRISGAENPATQAPQIGTTATGTSATPDPPASAAPPSTKDYLFIAFYGAAGEEADDDTWSDTPPASYSPTPPRQKACGVAGTNLGGMIAAAERQLNTGAAQNPGTFAKDVSAAWRAQTILIHPASSTISETDGASAGVAAVDGDGAAVIGAAGSSDGSGSVAGVSGFVSGGEGSTAASATVDGDAAAIASGSGQAAGAAGVVGASGLTAGSVGTSDGVASAGGEAAATAGGQGAAQGAATASGETAALAGGEGHGDGSAALAGPAAAIATADGSAVGDASVDGQGEDGAGGASIVEGEGTAAGIATVSGAGAAVVAAGAAIDGASAVDGVSGAIAGAEGASSGASSIAGFSDAPATQDGRFSVVVVSRDFGARAKRLLLSAKSRRRRFSVRIGGGK